ncbi:MULTISPECIES: hypothetical protein [unclassified Campylobacter]|uniref:hypothetical protein n=1 Tax=unclassified Campylobacter TaxID=2593542 RepID=UPI0012383787|nr:MULTISPECIES: hypothetical protein [unclassified Campylobacter]KAA6226258.1 hypothetical protein FMM55_05200 [Campylobacter sp. LR196d]KAA6226688.1 hypothetical protein FMM57_05385 [Campylobacter sp. LR286c]KAA6227720.1 hypothetical protein FMM54_02290 [Campylobacter sp. LR185c]KAA6231251.1 hypothetical protein FMM58_03560 [Campylobacter sp. LR291e]KAA6234140.1 hypothetical protein FMM56_01490 [Campylobacter sp. LR264d]
MSVDYDKYSDMNEKQLVSTLMSTKKKEAKLKVTTQEKLKEYKALIKFLKKELKNRIDKLGYEEKAKSKEERVAKPRGRAKKV